MKVDLLLCCSSISYLGQKRYVFSLNNYRRNKTKFKKLMLHASTLKLRWLRCKLSKRMRLSPFDDVCWARVRVHVRVRVRVRVLMQVQAREMEMAVVWYSRTAGRRRPDPQCRAQS